MKRIEKMENADALGFAMPRQLNGADTRKEEIREALVSLELADTKHHDAAVTPRQKDALSTTPARRS